MKMKSKQSQSGRQAAQNFLISLVTVWRSIWQRWHDLSVHSESYRKGMALNFYIYTLVMLRYYLDVLMKQYDPREIVPRLKVGKISENHRSHQLFVWIYIPRICHCRDILPCILRGPPKLYFKPKNLGNDPVLGEKCTCVRVLGLSEMVGGIVLPPKKIVVKKVLKFSPANLMLHSWIGKCPRSKVTRLYHLLNSK